MSENNYNELYENHLMCKNCERKTTGIQDFMTKTEKITKTCQTCRTGVLKSQAKKPQHKPLTLKQQVSLLTEVLKKFEPSGILDNLSEEYPRLKEILV